MLAVQACEPDGLSEGTSFSDAELSWGFPPSLVDLSVDGFSSQPLSHKALHR